MLGIFTGEQSQAFAHLAHGGNGCPILSTNDRLRKNNDLHGLLEEVG
jgi:hypothetical protein